MTPTACDRRAAAVVLFSNWDPKCCSPEPYREPIDGAITGDRQTSAFDGRKAAWPDPGCSDSAERFYRTLLDKCKAVACIAL